MREQNPIQIYDLTDTLYNDITLEIRDWSTHDLLDLYDGKNSFGHDWTNWTIDGLVVEDHKMIIYVDSEVLELCEL